MQKKFQNNALTPYNDVMITDQQMEKGNKFHEDKKMKQQKKIIEKIEKAKQELNEIVDKGDLADYTISLRIN